MIERFCSPTLTQLSLLASEMDASMDNIKDTAMVTASTITAGKQCPIIINLFGEGNQLVMAEFGMSPAWAKYTVNYPSVNAPMETITGVKNFKKPYRKSQFCLVPITGFYTQDDRLITQLDNTKKVFTVPAIYEYNDGFEIPTYSFSLLTRQVDATFLQQFSISTAQTWLMEVLPNQRDYFLVSNWKFNKGYMTLLDASVTHLA